jgi:D-alanine-D-alanine ligase
MSVDKKKICFLYGGKSREHEVSLRSAASVISRIDRTKFDPICVAINQHGCWYLQDVYEGGTVPGGTVPLAEDAKRVVSAIPGRGLFSKEGKIDVDFVFPILHGSFGEDGTVQGLLELLDLPFAGADTLGSALGMNKEKMKRVWTEHGLPVVPFEIITKDAFSQNELEKVFSSIKVRFGDKVFVKPVSLGSSVGVSKVESIEGFIESLETVFTMDMAAMVEPAMNAREIECSVVGNVRPKSYPPGEIIPSHEFYSYDAKYIDEDGAALIIPAKFSSEKEAEIREIAVNAFLAGGITGYARVDFFVERKSERVFLNEINTIPGFTNISMFPKMCEAAGMSFTELITEIIELGYERYEKRKGLSFQYSG